jgi:NAD(P) transhydrogenase subunit alpha
VRLAVPRETAPRESRVALAPETAGRLATAGFEVLVEAGAGERAAYPDEVYERVGAQAGRSRADLFAAADVVLKVRPPGSDGGAGKHEAEQMREGTALVSFLRPAAEADLLARLAARRVTAFSMDLVPRIARAQKMDALSAMASLAGYKAALLAANTLGKFLPMLITAAGTVSPARVFVLGAGVAGLQAIATARRLGAVVEAFDTRPVVREQVESLGASFAAIELPEDEPAEDVGGYAREHSEEFYGRERELVARLVAEADVVITTAQVPGHPAPLLVTAEMVGEMRPGSVIVDLAAESGGNCELTRRDEVVVAGGVTIHGETNVPGLMAAQASLLYGRTAAALVQHLVKGGQLALDFEDEITRAACVTHAGEVRAT